MNKNSKKNFLAVSIMAVMTTVSGQDVIAHTRLDTPQVNENTKISNNLVIEEGCVDNSVIGTSVVIPDGVDSTITVDGQPYAGTLTDFVQNWGNSIQKILSRAVFSYEDVKTNTNGNIVGFWAGGGSPLPTELLGFIPFRISAVIIEPTSCAKSIKFYISIADVCQITPTSGFSDETVNLWTHNSLGTPYDRVSATDDGPASLTITRTSSLPTSCGTGVAVEVKPSAAQINRDMPIKIDGSQVWPK